MQTNEKIEFPGLPLAVYREIIAHLQQVTGVRADVIPQLSQDFDYTKSQIAGLLIRFTADTTPECRSKVKEVLAYYQERYKN
jgi:hypothetical protein